MKEIKKELSSFDKYHKVILFLIKLVSVLKNKLFIMRDVFNIKKTILFKIIMQKIILSRMREDDNNNNNQHKSNKFFDNQFNRNQQSDKARDLNKFKKNDKSNNHFNIQTSNKRTYTKIKNKKNNHYFEYHKSKHYHRDCSKKNKWSKTTVIRMTTLNSKNDEVSQTFQRRNKKRSIKVKNSILIKEWI